MKKIFLVIAISFLLVSLAIAQNQGSENQMAGSAENSETVGNQPGTQVQQQNEGEETQIQNEIQSRVVAGNYVSENGKQLQISEEANSRVRLEVGGVSAQTSMKMTQEQVQDRIKLMAELSNGKNAEIKIMPDAASEKAIERLRLKVCSEDNNCTIELKEVGNKSENDDEKQLAYELQAERHSKLLGLFTAKMQVKAQVSAENGELIRIKKPWWAFLATEPEE